MFIKAIALTLLLEAIAIQVNGVPLSVKVGDGTPEAVKRVQDATAHANDLVLKMETVHAAAHKGDTAAMAKVTGAFGVTPNMQGIGENIQTLKTKKFFMATAVSDKVTAGAWDPTEGRVLLGSAFHATDATPESRAGTILHEASHAIGTKDVFNAQGQPTDKQKPDATDKIGYTDSDLTEMKNNPTFSKNLHQNADSWRVFGELCRRELERRAYEETDLVKRDEILESRAAACAMRPPSKPTSGTTAGGNMASPASRSAAKIPARGSTDKPATGGAAKKAAGGAVKKVAGAAAKKPSAGANKPATRGAAKKPAAGAAKPAARGASKPAARGASKPAARPAAKPAARGAAKPAARGASKPAARPAAKPAARGAAKPATRGAAKPAARGAVNPPARPAAPAKPAARGAFKPAAHPAAKPAARGAAKPPARPAAPAKPAARPASKSAARSAAKPAAAKSPARPAAPAKPARPASKPAARSAAKPAAAKPPARPAAPAKPAAKPAAAKPPAQPAAPAKPAARPAAAPLKPAARAGKK